eukprot:CAMPEP_0174725376 /NCGR_PEP_ID=MMETSP1094-20130205/45407_1 /TAXON_ID=156173 /ORGANISM="Chrysochromulina brevifilum, Strain UTEX LB 985" /LENGTH=319 /DNA_ID=CAMNT_0015926763 /DNA_START=344 /DNA_END=1303 /DNA_ORIENTATION=+
MEAAPPAAAASNFNAPAAATQSNDTTGCSSKIPSPATKPARAALEASSQRLTPRSCHGLLLTWLSPPAREQQFAVQAHRELAAVRVQAAMRGCLGRRAAHSRRALCVRQAEAAVAVALARRPSTLKKRKFKRFENDYVPRSTRVPKAPAVTTVDPATESPCSPAAVVVEKQHQPTPLLAPSPPLTLPALPSETNLLHVQDQLHWIKYALQDERCEGGTEHISLPETFSTCQKGSVVVKRPSFMKRLIAHLSETQTPVEDTEALSREEEEPLATGEEPPREQPELYLNAAKGAALVKRPSFMKRLMSQLSFQRRSGSAAA